MQPADKRSEVPEGLWLRCTQCEAMLFRKSLEQNLHVCPECDHHFRIDATTRIEQLVDPGSFEPLWTDLEPTDALSFIDRVSYADRLKKEQGKTGRRDAIQAGRAFIKGRGVVLAVMDNSFMMASMGSVVGETITRAIELATTEDKPMIIVCAGGGARMQESTLAVSQMIKTSAALARFDDAGGLYLAVLTDPTTGGTAASFAMLGDITIAEPKALIGFTGARVIANTVRQELPPGFQRAEFLVDKGFVDRVVHRHELRNEIARLIDYAGK
jgi:acetyl-CoA carboxylase carboxyl transferase subunit beta